MNIDIKSFYIKYKEYILILACFIAGLILLAILADYVIIPAFIHNRSTLKVPNVIGKNFSDAQAILENEDLVVVKQSEQYNEYAPAGVVMTQNPKPDQTVKEGRTIYLIVSRGKETLTMPSLIGQSSRNARVNLMKIGLAVGDITYASSNFYGPDTVIVQSINPGQQIVYGKPVNLVISRGPEAQVMVPALTSNSYADALKILLESGLSVGAVDSVGHETYMPNTVVRQSPEAGKLVRAGSRINITVSK